MVLGDKEQLGPGTGALDVGSDETLWTRGRGEERRDEVSRGVEVRREGEVRR